METTEAIHKWRCIRRFKQDEPVPEEALRKVLEAGRRASSWELYEEIKSALGIPEKMYLLTLLTLGIPDESPNARPRKDFDKIVSRGKVGQKF